MLSGKERLGFNYEKANQVLQNFELQKLIHPDNKADGEIIRQLTGQKELNGVIRELIRDLTGGQIQFVETVAPLFD